MAFSDNARQALLDYYFKQGFEKAITLCFKLMKSPEYKTYADVNNRNQVSGSLCETVLELCILEYCYRNKEKTKDWFYSNGLIVKDLNSYNTDFSTEIDFTLFTPSTVILFECKCYMGQKAITENGIIERKGKKPFDVFSQQAVHVEAFSAIFNSFRKTKRGKIQYYRAAAFLFDTGEFNDLRKPHVKNIFPFLDYNSVFNFLDGISIDSNWQLDYVRRAVELIEKDSIKLRAKHIDYVKSLHHKNK